jgi:hypothetical protein
VSTIKRPQAKRNLGEPTYEIVEITPEFAAELLGEHNTHNRNIRRRVVAAYATDMAAGKWRETGEGIKRSHDGTLLDGQHRLSAIVESGVTVRMLVVGNLPPQAQEAVDGGAKRKFSDILHLRGEQNYNLLGAVVRRAWYWKAGLRGSTGNYTPTSSQLLDVLDEHPEVRASATAAAGVRHSVPIAGSILGLCHWLFSNIDADDCNFFFERLTDGVNLAADHPIHVLRRTVIENQSAKSRLTETVVTAYVVKTWNAYRDGRTVGLLRFKPGGASPEQFPEPK